MKVVAGLDELVGQYVSNEVGARITNTPFVGFAVYDSTDTFVAGVVISNYRGTDCEISMAADTPNWARKQVMRIIFEYVFYKMKCVRCTCIVPKRKTSKRTRRFLEGIGFLLEGNLRRAYDGETDALVYGLLRGDCRFLAENLAGGLNGKEVGTGTAAST